MTPTKSPFGQVPKGLFYGLLYRDHSLNKGTLVPETGNGLFVAVAYDGANRVMTSQTPPDGVFTVPAVTNPTNASYYIKT